MVERFNAREKEEARFIDRRWPDRIVCPGCVSKRYSSVKNRYSQPFWCQDTLPKALLRHHRDLGITHSSARLSAMRIRKVWIVDLAAKSIGPVEVEETYFGDW